MEKDKNLNDTELDKVTGGGSDSCLTARIYFYNEYKVFKPGKKVDLFKVYKLDDYDFMGVCTFKSVDHKSKTAKVEFRGQIYTVDDKNYILGHKRRV